MSNVPVFIFHKGYADYLPYVISCAKSYGNSVVLAGNNENCHLDGVEWVDADKYVPAEYNDFISVFKQYSTYTYLFDTICFQRYFIMRQYMKVHNVDKIFFLDSDALLYVDVSKFYSEVDCGVSLSIPHNQENYGWSACGHCSFWTREYLDDFLNYVYEIYKNDHSLLKEKWEYHQANKLPGGVCDMTLLYLWSKKKDKVYNNALVHENAVFDNCVAIKDNYFKDEYLFNSALRIKKIRYQNNEPYFVNSSGDLVKANLIHCSGAAKSLIGNIYSKNYLSALWMRYFDYVKRAFRKLVK